MRPPFLTDELIEGTDHPPPPLPPPRHIMCLRLAPAYLTGPRIIKLIGVGDLRSSPPEMAPLVAVNDKLTDSLGFNPNYTWTTRAKTWHL